MRVSSDCKKPLLGIVDLCARWELYSTPVLSFKSTAGFHGAGPMPPQTTLDPPLDPTHTYVTQFLTSRK